MIDELINLFSEVLEVSPDALSEDSSPENVEEWDSLKAMELVASIEEQFEIELSTKDIMKMRTIGIAREVIEKKKASL